MIRSPNPLLRAIAIHTTAMIAGFLTLSLLAYALSPRFSPSPSGELYSKYLFFREQPDRFNLYFLGDSRAFCAVQPEQIDKLLGTRSFNLAHWSNWLPTQYPMAADLAHLFPTNATVVMFIGHVNFQGEGIYDKYPIGLDRVPEYLEMGFTPEQLWDNIASFNPFLRFLHKRGTVRTLLENNLARPWITLRDDPRDAPLGTAPTSELINRLAGRPEVDFIDPQYADGKTTSLALHKNNGAYERVELDEAFFRAHQHGGPDQHMAGPPRAPEPKYLALYKRILDDFSAAGVGLVVVELEEAPHVYGSRANRERWRHYLRSFAKPLAEAHGFPYLTLPLETIPDTGYFDYDHMNSKGIALFTPMLAKALTPFVGKRKADVP